VEFERRQHSRQKLYSPEYFDIGAENGGVIVDLSEDGLGFQAAVRVEKGREATFSFTLGTGYRIAARARIAWVGPTGKSGGTTFTRMPEDSRSIIREWLAKAAEHITPQEAAIAGEPQTNAPESESETPLIIERVESRHVLGFPPPPPVEAPPEAPVAVEPETQAGTRTDLHSDSQADVAADVHADAQLEAQPRIEPDAPTDVQEITELADQEIAQPGIDQNAQLVADPAIPSVVEPEMPPAFAPVLPAAPPVEQLAGETVVETPQYAREDRVPPAAARLHEVPPHPNPSREISSGIISESAPQTPAETAVATPQQTPSQIAAEPGQKTNERETVRAAVERESSGPPPPSFPLRNAGELFSRSPWISGQSFPEEERSHKGLIAVIVIGLIVVGTIVSFPYLRAHRQQIGAAFVNMGRSIAGQPASNAASQSEQAPAQGPQQAAPSASQQQGTQQSTQQTEQAPTPTSAPPSNSPSASGAIPGNTPAPVTKPSEVPAPSGSGVTAAPVAPSGSQTPASELPSSTPGTKSSTSATDQNSSAAPPAGSTSFSLPASAAAAADNGQTEFKRAQQYLNGSGGVAADPTEAAEWFWRSLEKGNTPAAIPLADLYLEGKGVSRSCLQARILLTAASHKGNAEAIEKLSQLPENCEQ